MDTPSEIMTDEHRVTATEPCWTEQDHVPGPNGAPEPVGEFETGELVDALFDESEYECTCGTELDSWSDVQDHFLDVTEGVEAEEDAELSGGDFDMSLIPDFEEAVAQSEGTTTIYYEGLMEVDMDNPDMAGTFILGLLGTAMRTAPAEIKTHRYQVTNSDDLDEVTG